MKKISGFIVRILVLALLVATVVFVIKETDKPEVKEKIEVPPLKYEDIVEKYAKEYNLDIFHVFSIIKAESKFDAKAVSSVDARGLMQIMAETANWYASKNGISNFNQDDLFDPDTNVKIGCWYISQLKGMFGETRRDIVTAAYNAGNGNVRKWLDSGYYDFEKDEFTNIPFPETRQYVINVNNNYREIKKAYNHKYPIDVNVED